MYSPVSTLRDSSTYATSVNRRPEPHLQRADLISAYRIRVIDDFLATCGGALFRRFVAEPDGIGADLQ